MSQIYDMGRCHFQQHNDTIHQKNIICEGTHMSSLTAGSWLAK